MKDSSDIKPCPFCGSFNIWKSPGRLGTTKGEPFLYCRDCGAEGPYNENEWNDRKLFDAALGAAVKEIERLNKQLDDVALKLHDIVTLKEEEEADHD